MIRLHTNGYHGIVRSDGRELCPSEVRRTLIGELYSRGLTLQQVADIMKLPVNYLTQRAPGNQSALDDLKARGTEIEIHYNPTGYLTAKLNLQVVAAK